MTAEQSRPSDRSWPPLRRRARLRPPPRLERCRVVRMAIHGQGAREVWQKSAPKGKSAKSASEVNAARRTGGYVETDKKFSGGTNQSAHSTVPNAKKLDENGETFRHATVSHEFKTALQQARLAKKMTQASLATAINEKASVINEYESGKACAATQNKSLGVRLPKAK
eukprot:Skav223427  [mRNA]  locus=scaffold350:447179:451129:+ [translate_table: standard]